MTRKIAWAAAVGALVAAGIGTGTAIATSGDHDQPITGPALEKASTAALHHTGQGRVTETEVGDEDSYYEVEVELPSGRHVDVQLDRDFRVVGSSGDIETDHDSD